MCDRFGDFSPTLFYCLCVQPCFLLLRQVRICRILFRGINSPAFYQYVRLHSDTLPHTFKRITHVWVHDAQNHWQRLRQVGASYRCIEPDSTLCIVRIHSYNMRTFIRAHRIKVRVFIFPASPPSRSQALWKSYTNSPRLPC